MLCNESQKKLGAYADGELDESEARETAEHIKNCWRCEERFLFVKSLKEAAAALVAPELIPRRAEEKPASFNLWPLVKARIAADGKTIKARLDIFERHFYKLSLAGAMLLYLAADFSPAVTMLFWGYFLYHLCVYSDKFDFKRTLVKI